MRAQQSVGEQIANHHWRDAHETARRAQQAFEATELGAALRAFEHCIGDAWRIDTELGFMDGRSDKAAKRAWEKADEARRTLMTHLKRAIGA